MKVTVPEISFHNRDPILSVDIQLNAPDGIIRMATAGTDTHVVVSIVFIYIAIVLYNVYAGSQD